ncbi:MAG: Mth938-like domain-containing protein [Pseudomonadota bacterium]
MKLHLTTAENNNLITGYGADFIEINRKRYAQNLIVLPNELILNWNAASFSDLTAAHFIETVHQNPEVLLLGTGSKHQFLHPKITQNLTEKNIPIECMTTAAACRTYNILMSEGRNVAAALLLN